MINEDATFRWKGYRSTDLTHGSNKKVWAVCDVCGKSRWVLFSKYRDLCASCSHIGLHAGAKHPQWKGGKVIKICEQCGKEYKPERAKTDTTRFCSRKCHTEWQRNSGIKGEKHPNWKGNKVKKQCKQCSKEYEVSKHEEKRNNFCSMECYHTWRRINMIGEKHWNWQGGNITKICKHCGKEYNIPKCMAQRSNFCSRECLSGWRRNITGKEHWNWKGGIAFEPYCEKFNRRFKESIREKFNRICFLCGKTENINGKKLCIHHVNYDKNCLCDGSDCEFVPLCASCHGKTNGNRNYWENLIMNKLTKMDIS